MIPRALRFEHGKLLLLDQRLLPAEEKWIACRTADQVAAAIADLAVRGAPAIGIAAAYGLALEASRVDVQSLEIAARRLVSARPTAVNLQWATGRLMDVARRIDPQSTDLGSALLREAEAIHREDAEACRSIGRYGLPLLGNRLRVLTHCNAGALATGGIGTALAPVYTAAEHGQKPKVFACEARPVMQGARLTTWELSRAGIDVTLLVDAAAAFLIASGEVDSVWVGADRIARNGDVANKVGTYGLACAAARSGIPFYVAAPRSTWDERADDGDSIPIEHRAPDELSWRFTQPVSASGIKYWTPAFDITPAALVTAYVSERGVEPGDRE